MQSPSRSPWLAHLNLINTIEILNNIHKENSDEKRSEDN